MDGITKRDTQKKKNRFFISPLVMLIFISACAGSAYNQPKSNWPSASLLNPIPPSASPGNTGHGICLTLSKRSSLNIDVECIVDYVQRELSMIGDNPTLDQNNPWISWNFQF